MAGILNKKILIYSTIRNATDFIYLYYSQLKEIVETFSDCEFYLSIYENDSSDDTAKLLNAMDWSFFKDFSVICENLNRKSYGSIVNEDRVKNLSEARNKAIFAKDFLQKVDYIMMIESDIKYSMETVKQILNFDDLEDFDIVSGHTWADLELGYFELYDTWATRSRDNKDYKDLYKNESVIDLDPLWKNLNYSKVYSTSNGICLYKADSFKNGIKYDFLSQESGEWDCEQAVLCEKFRHAGNDKIFIIHTAPIEHLGHRI